MKPMTINGMEITFNERPKHKSVVAARGIMVNELMKLIDVTKVDPEKGVEDFIKEQVMKDTSFTSKLFAIKNDLDVDQTIILSTGMDYTTLQELKDEMYADEFIELYNKSKEALGGKTAKDFFDIYPSSMNFKGMEIQGI